MFVYFKRVMEKEGDTVLTYCLVSVALVID